MCKNNIITQLYYIMCVKMNKIYNFRIFVNILVWINILKIKLNLYIILVKNSDFLMNSNFIYFEIYH